MKLLRLLSLFVYLCRLHVSAENVLILLVEAPHIDYSSISATMKTIAKHPSNFSKNGDVGHAWIYLKGNLDGQEIVCEGGHSGELGLHQPTYIQGVLENVRLGSHNPVSYLFCAQEDGYFQKGNGGHIPTCAAKMTLSDEEFGKAIAFIHEYPYQRYSLTERQCCTFVSEMARLFGLHFIIQRQLEIATEARIAGAQVRLWRDSRYSKLLFACPDLLEKELKKAIADGQLEDALKWYKRRNRPSLPTILHQSLLFPRRLIRYMMY
ncbi:Uncharacterized protein PHSC3_001162 [Chlamydiales bacterium STE3]|nr:Uncharacterized protein PHSC3_001162 [Chlamydiales bacterium STE3]